MTVSLNDLSDPDAVRAAMAEFDRLGRKAFLEQYAIDKARGWLVVDERGREYDAKAIAGAAHGRQFPHRGPLAATDFHGGEATPRVLRRMGFTVREPEREARNPPWTRDELILALDLYVRHRPSIPGDRHPDVIELSDTLGRLAAAEGRAGAGGRFRNPNGVGMKLGNLARLDPDYAGAGRRGLAHGGKADEEVWRDFVADPGACAPPQRPFGRPSPKAWCRPLRTRRRTARPRPRRDGS